MEIDFHYGTTYVLARMAGFKPDDASIIAYSSQYVDDAGTYFASQKLKMFEWHAIFFDNYAIYEYIDSSHSMLNLANWKELDQHKVWIPFHFLPAGFGEEFIEKATCKKAWDIEAQWLNPIAKDMVDEVTTNSGNFDWGLYRLGITMHVLADTFAHQNFAGIKCEEINTVSNIKIASPAGYSAPRLFVPSLGHAQAEHLPDLPFVVWSYVNKKGEEIIRDNPSDYTSAIDIMLKVMKKYRDNFNHGGVEPTPDDFNHDRQKILSLFTELQDKDGTVRNQTWLQKIEQGEFKCCNGGEKAEYFKEGDANSWWYEVTQLCDWSKDIRWWTLGYRQFNKGFMTCNYKRFQDALKSHFYFVEQVLFPKYNICVL
jgi:hypothetical protein